MDGGKAARRTFSCSPQRELRTLSTMVMVKRKFAVTHYKESECEAFLNFFIGFSCPKAIFCGQKKVFESALMYIHS